MTEIRVTYSGLISFFVGSSSIFTGLIFTLIITRSLTQEEFGSWAVIGTLLGYALILNPIISFWNTREIARGGKTGKTGITMGGAFASLAFLIYLIIAFFFTEEVIIDKNIILFASILVPLEFVRSILTGITNGYKPQLEEYGRITFEVVKIVLGLGFLYIFDMGLFGLIIVIFCATFVNVIFLTFSSRKIIRSKFDKQLIVKWLKLFWIPLFPRIPQTINSSEIIIFTLMTGGVGGVAYWTAAFTIGRLVRHSKVIAKAVYPKILQGDSKHIFEANFTYVMYFAFPLASISLVFAKAGLFALNPIYEIAYPTIFFIVPTIFLRSITEIFGSVLNANEKVDVKKDSNFKDYLKSKLIVLPALKIFHRSSYLAILIVTLFLMSFQKMDDVELVIIWSIVAFSTQIPFTAYVYFMVRKEIKPKFELYSIIKYLLASATVFGILYFMLENFLKFNESIFIFLPNLIGFLLIGVIGYLGLTYTIDRKTRNIVKKVIKEIKSKK